MPEYNSNINGIMFSVSVEESLFTQVQILFQAIETIPPKNIKDGYKLEIGFSVFILVENDYGYCIVVPDYTKSPFSDTTEDLTIALWIQLEQIEDGKFHNVSANEYESYYVYQLLKIRPALIKALALPYDYIVVFEGDTINAILNEQDEDIMT